MGNRLELNGHWRPRREPLEACVERLHRYFALLAAIDPHLAIWYEKGRSRQDALKRQPEMTDRAVIAKLLEKGRNRADIGRAVIEDLGYRASLWNGLDDPDGANTSVRIGIWAPTILNTVGLNPPQSLDPAADRETFIRLIEAAADAFELDWIELFERDAMFARPVRSQHPFLDWMLYLPRRIAAVPAPAEVRPGPHGGSIIITCPKPFAPNDTSVHPHLAAVGRALGFDPFEGRMLGTSLPKKTA